MSTLLLKTYSGSKILQFDTRSSFLVKIYIIFYCQYAEFRNAAYQKIHLNLLQSFLKIKLKPHSQLSLFLCFESLELTIPSSRKNVSNMLCLIMKILAEKNTLISLASVFDRSLILSGLWPKPS